MSMECGHLQRLAKQGKPVAYIGEINIAGIVGEIVLTPHALRRSENSPTHKVSVRSEGREWSQMGNAWKKDMKAGGWFFSVTLDGPTLPGPVYVTAFPDEDQPKDLPRGDYGEFTIKWGRPRGGRAMQPASPAPGLDDAIPY